MAARSLKLAFILSATDKMSRVVDQAVKNSTNRLSSFERTTSKISRSALRAGAMMTGAGAAVGAGIFAIGKSTADYASNVLDMSRAAGIETDAFQRIAYAASMSGIEAEKVTSSFVKFDKMIAAAAAGNKAYERTFKDLGIEIKDAAGNMRAPNEIFEDVADIFASVEDGVNKTALAVTFFGKSGAELIPVLNDGKKGLHALYAEGERLNLFMSNEAVVSAEGFGDKLDLVGRQAAAVKMQFGVALLPALIAAADKFSAVIARVTQWISDNPALAATIGDIVMNIAKFLIVGGSLAALIGTITFIVSKFTSAIKFGVAAVKLADKAFKLAKNSMLLFRIQYYSLIVAEKAYVVGQHLATAAVWLFNTALYANPIVWIIALIAALIAAVYLLVKHWDKVSAWFGKLWDKIRADFAAFWDGVKGIWTSITGFFSDLLDRIVSDFSNAWSMITDGIVSAWNGIGDYFSNLSTRFYEWGRDLLQGLWNGITSMFDKIIDGIKDLGSRIADEFKRELGINSPSKLFEKYGMNITQGLVVGVDRGSGAVDGAGMGMVGHMQHGLAAELNTNTVGAPVTNNGGSINYSPSIVINGPVTAETRSEFVRMLRQHAAEIIAIMRRERDNNIRLSFNS